MTDHKKIARRAYERSQRPTVPKMRAVRPGAYRIVNGVVIEDGGDLIDHRVLVDEPTVSGERKKVDK